MRKAVVARAQSCCEYCRAPQDASLAPHEPDHVIGEQHGGQTTLDNLAYACFRCNRLKGPNILLRFNDEQRVQFRTEMIAMGRYTPPQR